MARIEIPRDLVDCPLCGEPLRIETMGSTVMPGEIVVDLRVHRCDVWCRLLAEADKSGA